MVVVLTLDVCCPDGSNSEADNSSGYRCDEVVDETLDSDKKSKRGEY